MRKPVLLSFFILLSVGLFWSIVPMGCANIVPPTGGPRDSTPPRLLKITPADSTRNFRDDEITLVFDEFVDLKDMTNNIIFTPTFNVNPKISANARTIKIRFEEPLDSNTTYVLNFGNAIVDVNESNPLRNFTYIFSTGPALDSLELSGRVVLAETGGIDSTLAVVLHRKLADSVVRNEKAPYRVKLNPQGEFRFRYLPSDTFAIYVLDAQNQYYQDETKLFAFADEPVIAGSTDSVLLYAYRGRLPAGNTQSTASFPGIGSRGAAAADKRLRFTMPQSQQDLQGDYVLSFPVPLKNFDSSKIELTTDSTFNKINYSVLLDSSKKELRFKTVWKENTKYNLELQKDFASDTGGRQLLKTDTLFFITKKQADYGSISIRLKNFDAAKNPVLQFVQNNIVVLSVSVKGGSFSQKLFNPGEYNLRILFDENDNGKWDPGKFLGEKKQPEIVRPIERTITVKPAWDNEFDIAL